MAKSAKKTNSAPAKKKSQKRTIISKDKKLKLPVFLPVPLRRKAKVIYIDSCFFFPPESGVYSDNYQRGRFSSSGVLVAPILLPVGSVMKKVTVYYKNNTHEILLVWILKYHIDHHAYSGEVEVTYDDCPPGVSAPDDFLQKEINHFDAGGRILDKYMYRIEVSNIMKAGTKERLLRGIRIEYIEPA